MRRVSLAFIVLAGILARASAADPTPKNAKGTPLPAAWTYSKDGGKTFSDKAPMVSPTRTPVPENTVIATGKRVPTIIVGRSGGLGRQTRQVKNVQALPHCKIATREGHYCIFEVKKNTLVMKVFDLDGKQINQHTFTPRKQ